MSGIFSRQQHIYPMIKSNKDYLKLLAHHKRLEEVVSTEKHDYIQSMKQARDMLELALLAGDTTTQAIAYTRIGVELLRGENTEAIDYLSRACDIALTLSKEIRAYCFAMLARGYAQFKNYKLFDRYISMAVNCGACMAGQAVVTKDYVYHAYSAILEETSNGYILFENAKKALQSLVDIEREVKHEHNSYLAIWLPLDYAQCYMLQAEIEQSIQYLRAFYDNALEYKSERLLGKVIDHLDDLNAHGYGELTVVREFREMIGI